MANKLYLKGNSDKQSRFVTQMRATTFESVCVHVIELLEGFFIVLDLLEFDVDLLGVAGSEGLLAQFHRLTHVELLEVVGDSART